MRSDIFIASVLAAALAAPGLTAARLDPSLDANLIEAIHLGKVARVRRLLAQGANPNAKDADGTPVIMEAAVYSTAECIKLLLDRGADPNARHAAGATALIWAAGDRNKVKVLLEHHADVNARSGPGRTALLVAAAQDGSSPSVAALLRAGADSRVKDNLTGIPIVFTGGGGAVASIEAAKARDPRSLEMLLATGLPVNATDATGNTALSEAVLRGNRDNVRILLEHGADVNAHIGLAGNTPVMFAAIRNDVETARALLQKGAGANDANNLGETALMWAAYTDTREPALVRLLMDAGAEVNHRSSSGETAMSWAAQRGDTEITRMLREAGADEASAVSPIAKPDAPKPLAEAIESSLAAMQASGPTFLKHSGCISCHHQLLPMVATSLGREKGFRFDEAAADRNLKAVLGFVRPATEILFEGTDVLPDLPVTGGNLLISLHAAGYAPDTMTDALVHNIAGKQMGDGSWVGWAPRPPLESGDIQATALAIRSLRLYGMPGRKQEFDSRIALARKWLLAAKPKTTEESRMRMLGLVWAGAEARDIEDSLLKAKPRDPVLQREVATINDRLCTIQQSAGAFRTALETCQAALAIREKLAAREPGNDQLRAELAASYQNLAGASFMVGDWDQTEKYRAMALRVFEQLHRSDPANTEYHFALGTAYLRLAGLQEI